MRRSPRLLRAGVGLVLLAAPVAGCGSADDATVTEQEFRTTVTDRFGATAEQAGCITDYIFADYEPDEIEVLADEGMGALPQARWSPYLNASAACLTHDEPLDGVE